jgi:hypothetical protein
MGLELLDGHLIDYLGNFDEKEIFVVLVDGIHCHTAKCRKKPSAKNCSHKFSGPGFAYEMGVAIRRNQLVWINGPCKALVHDVTPFVLQR